MSSLGPGNYDDIKGLRDLQIGQRLQEGFPSEIEKKRVHCFVAGELLLVFKCYRCLDR